MQLDTDIRTHIIKHDHTGRLYDTHFGFTFRFPK